MPKTYHIWTIGCQMNKAESERIAARLEELGYTVAPHISGADLIILNSCAVRGSAEEKVINKLHDLKRLKQAKPDTLIALTGCMVEPASQADSSESAKADSARLRRHFPFIDYFFKAGDYPPWLEKAPSQALPLIPHPSSFVPISQGCNNFCTYCIVPYRRGRERSRPFDEIVCEVRELVRRGAKEIILLGQNVDSYGRDLPGQPDLAGLLTELNSIAGLQRLRFLTNHPKDMSLKLIKAIARLDKVCPQINLPVQAGSNGILKAMGRGYTVGQYQELVKRIRENIPGVAISTDIIVGFPGETAAQYQETLGLLSTLKFDTVHVAAYSPREGTKAARDLKDDVPLAEKKERLAGIEQIQEKIQSDINTVLLGQEVEVLVERKNKGKWYGRTRTDKLVFFTGEKQYTGETVIIKVEKSSAWSLQGKLV
jgi:tRNA-2-methylthio-N6-dimethylallyladenosine synthase